MRDPKRIDLVLQALRQYWYKNPDLRLGQCLLNITRRGQTHMYYVEDDDLLAGLSDAIKNDPDFIYPKDDSTGIKHE